MGIASFLLVLRGVLYTKNVRSATLRLGGYYMPGGTISKGGTICQFIRYLLDERKLSLEDQPSDVYFRPFPSQFQLSGT